MMEPIWIDIGLQGDGCVYALRPSSRSRIREVFPQAALVPNLFIGYESEADFFELQAPLWSQVAQMLTGLTPEQLEHLGGVVLFDPMSDKEVWRSHQAHQPVVGHSSQ